MNIDTFLNVIADTLIDSVKLLPFLFFAYFLIEYFEHRHSDLTERILAGGGKFGCISGALLGLIPQCGFSAVAANLYSSKVITVGTLLAVFLSTSDEAVPVLAAKPGLWNTLLVMFAMKFIIAAFFGFVIDRLPRFIIPTKIRGGYSGKIEEVDCHEHKEDEGIFYASLRHTLHIFLFIVIFEFILNMVMAIPGQDKLAFLFGPSKVLTVFVAGLVGLIPNCAASVLLTEMYSSGTLSFAGLFAGLSTGAGIGPLILLRTNKNKKQALAILLSLYILGVLTGLLLLLFGF